MRYHADNVSNLHAGTYLKNLTLENVKITDLKRTSRPIATAEAPLTVTFKNTTIEFTEDAPIKEPFTLGENSYVNVVVE